MTDVAAAIERDAAVRNKNLEARRRYPRAVRILKRRVNAFFREAGEAA